MNRIQRIIEGQNLEIKKTIYTYSSLIEQQRKIIFAKRNEISTGESILDFFKLNSPHQYNRLTSVIEKEELKLSLLTNGMMVHT